MLRQAFVNGTWREGLPTEQGQQFRYLTPAGFVYGTFELQPEQPKLWLTKLAFKQRFTPEERMDIRTAAALNPIMYDFQDLVDSATYIDLERIDTIASVNALEQYGLIAEGRAAEILSPPVNEDERWNMP